jgi:hypothetical protein
MCSCSAASVLGDNLLQGPRLTAKVRHLAARSRTCRVARQATFAGFEELLRPAVIKTFGDTFPAAQLGNARLAAQAVQGPRAKPHRLGNLGWDGNVKRRPFFIILTTAVTLHAAGKTDIQTAEQAAQALRPIAGNAVFFLFSLGLIGTGLFAIPVLAGSVAYAAGEARGWHIGLERPLNEARPFYLVITIAIVLGIAVDFSPLDPIKALVWSAVVNGVIVVPIMAAMMVVANKNEIMGEFVAALWQRILGWIATAIMAAAVIAMLALM